MDFSFNIEFAKRYGVDEAIMVKSFQFWIRLNKANKTNYHDLRYWTYNTNKSLTEYYPFWTEKQVRRIIESLVDKEILIKGNYNKIAYDRTIWYAFMNEDLYLSDNFHLEEIGDYQKVNTILPNGQMENTKQSNGISRKGKPIPVANQVLNTFTNSVNIENLSDFTSFEKITIDDSQSFKVNPFSVVANLQGEKEEKKISGKRKEESQAEPKPERKPNPTYEAFTVFCQTFEQLSGAAYPTDQKGHYIMSPKDAGGMVYLLRWLEKVDRNNDTNEALKVFLQAAWSLPDKWLKANFTPPILYGQANKVYTAYQTSSPAAKKKAYDDEADRLLNEYIQTLKQTQ
jgi:hypothetical protein